MTNRREFLQAADMTGMAHRDHMAAGHRAVTSETRGAVPDVQALTHEGKLVKFGSDLIGDRVVTINFMSLRQEKKLPISTHMAALAKAFGHQLGSDVHMISITSDPDHDTVERLAAFHRKLGGYAGWTFVTTPIHSSELLARRFYRHGRDLALGGRTDLVQYGNAKVGLWAAFPHDVNPHQAAERVNAVIPRPVALGEARRAGPRRIDQAGPSWSNRIA